MPQNTNDTFDHLPVLSAGRHRSARRGACFMEYASFLADERWSDHPNCTHPALGALARAVNDCTSNRDRGLLAPLIPSVIGIRGDGLRGEDERIDIVVGVRAGCAAVAVASESRQKSIAVGLIHAEAFLPESLEWLRPQIRAALETAPAAASWGYSFARNLAPRPGNMLGAMHILTTVSVLGIAEACLPTAIPNDADVRLRTLLEATIVDCRRVLGLDTVPAAESLPPISQKSSRAFENA